MAGVSQLHLQPPWMAAGFSCLFTQGGMAIFFSHLPPDLAVHLHSKCCRGAHGKGVEQTDLLARGSNFAPLSCSSAKCFASLNGRSQEQMPLLAPPGSVGGSVGSWGSEEQVKALLNLCPLSCHLPRSTSAHGFCASGCVLLWGCLLWGRPGWPRATDLLMIP